MTKSLLSSNHIVVVSMKYRSRTEIAAMILQSARTGATKTKIMYKAYMSYTQVKEYLNFLQKSNLIKYGEDTQLYSVTEKGMRFLRAYDEISGLVSTKTNGKIVKPVRTGF